MLHVSLLALDCSSIYDYISLRLRERVGTRLKSEIVSISHDFDKITLMASF